MTAQRLGRLGRETFAYRKGQKRETAPLWPEGQGVQITAQFLKGSQGDEHRLPFHRGDYP